MIEAFPFVCKQKIHYKYVSLNHNVSRKQKNTMKKILLLFLFVQICLVSEFVFVNGCFLTAKHHIHILSNLPSNSPQLKVHCASGDDDLGDHVLYPNQDYQWSFCADFLPTTLYFCHFWWGKKNQAFEVFHEKLTKLITHESVWIPKSDGIYFSNHTRYINQAQKKYDWNNS